MNYRHAFHAGNFADVFKHLVLTRLIVALARKETAFRVIDTHAGAGLYDLAGAEAQRSPEWRDGVARFDAARLSPEAEDLARPFRDALAQAREKHGASTYPGSPLVAQSLLRAQDRLIASDAHSETAWLLKRALGGDRRVKILEQDGWITLNATIPPPERRGLVLIDPPFESPDEFATLARALNSARRKWPTGIFAAWHPVKDVGVVERFARDVTAAGPGETLRSEIEIDDPAARGLNACGMLILNPPWRLEEDLTVLLPELAGLLGRGRARWRCDRLAGGEAGMPSPAPRGAGRASRERSP